MAQAHRTDGPGAPAAVEVPQRDAATENIWPVCRRDKDRLEYAAERVYDAREVLRKVLAKEPLRKDEAANAALDLNAVLLLLREMGVAVPVPIQGS